LIIVRCIDAAVYAGMDPSGRESYRAPLKTDTPPASSSGGLSRSHSSPNIAKMMQDEDAAAAVGGQLPRQQPDRSTKPLATYAALARCADVICGVT